VKAAAFFLLTAALATGCRGDDSGRPVFERAEQALRGVDGLRAHLVVDSAQRIERTMTFDGADAPLDQLHPSQWVKHPRRFACGHGFECARGDLDVEAAARELGPLLPQLPVSPSALGPAKIEVRLDSRGALHRIDVEGQAFGARAELDLRPIGP
jgi:hypothetical protein